MTIVGVAMVPSAMNHTSGSYSICMKNYLVTWLYLMRGWGIPIDLWFIEGSCVIDIQCLMHIPPGMLHVDQYKGPRTILA